MLDMKERNHNAGHENARCKAQETNNVLTVEAMDKKELRRRVEQSQLELDYWHGRADQMRAVLDGLERDYLAHHTDCISVRQRRLSDAVGRALDSVAVLEGSGGSVPQAGVASSESSGRSSPTEAAPLLGGASQQPTSQTAMAAEFSRGVGRLAKRAELKSMSKEQLEEELRRAERRTRHQRDDYNAIRARLTTLANEFDDLQQQQQGCCRCLPCGCDGGALEDRIRTAIDRPGRLVDV